MRTVVIGCTGSQESVRIETTAGPAEPARPCSGCTGSQESVRIETRRRISSCGTCWVAPAPRSR